MRPWLEAAEFRRNVRARLAMHRAQSFQKPVNVVVVENAWKQRFEIPLYCPCVLALGSAEIGERGARVQVVKLSTTASARARRQAS